ncbi:RNA polymerase sigma-70 factor (ECF subfamily) [Pedobacter africanus]|uniref:RNA polymerase sigma-70 factor (ECF subfamily) n=1 Tax=Pedobacter africanus TaxID=151894 RepID=A0ACC6KXN6_9SPHI|nr:RNA polymerase sigma-70 factor [Pedobacter africanus]MDR6784001.1 RNA polymerase sigma-70 factor (ECF subfamily) [Pedobacter africanus]
MKEEDLSRIPDEELLLLFKAGDRNAYEQIYNRYWAIMYVYARKIMADADDAQDIVQEVFTYLWHKGAELSIKTSLSVYLYTAVRYRIFDLLDHRKVRTDYKAYLQQFIDEGEYITDNQLRERELVAVIEREVALLPAKMREMFEMSRNEGLSHKEIAEKLGVSDLTVKKQVSNAVKILKEKLKLFSIFITINF